MIGCMQSHSRRSIERLTVAQAPLSLRQQFLVYAVVGETVCSTKQIHRHSFMVSTSECKQLDAIHSIAPLPPPIASFGEQAVSSSLGRTSRHGPHGELRGWSTIPNLHMQAAASVTEYRRPCTCSSAESADNNNIDVRVGTWRVA
jgi:hypothetical protein